jgi:hypothetical protein
VYLDFKGFLRKNVTIMPQSDSKMTTKIAERQRKHRDKMKAQNLTLVQVCPHDRVLELRSIAARMEELKVIGNSIDQHIPNRWDSVIKEMKALLDILFSAAPVRHQTFSPSSYFL